MVLLVRDDEREELERLSAPDVFVAGYVPHSRLFPLACAVIHHGGMGTSTQALRAGRPQLIVPCCNDQFDNAARLERSGVARVVSAQRYTADAGSRALAELLASDQIKRMTVAVSATVALEDGPRKAAALIAQVPRGPGREQQR